MTQDNDSAYRAEYDRLWSQAVTTLTAAARLEHDRYGTVDFADFLAAALRATAANLGDPHTLTAGRPGSLESVALSELLHGAVGLNPTMFDLAQYRTEPIQVTLNVAELVMGEEGAPGAPKSYDDAVYEAGDDDLATEISHQYVEAYSAYAERFTAAVQAEAEKYPGVSDLVTVIVDANIIAAGTMDGPGLENPSEGDSEPLVWHFWSTARESIGMPVVPQAMSSTGFHRGCFSWFLRQPRVRCHCLRSTLGEPRTAAGIQSPNAIVAGCTSRSISTSRP